MPEPLTTITGLGRRASRRLLSTLSGWAPFRVARPRQTDMPRVQVAAAQEIASGRQRVHGLIFTNPGSGVLDDDLVELLTICETRSIFTVLLVQREADLDSAAAAVATHCAAATAELHQQVIDFAGQQRSLHLPVRTGNKRSSAHQSLTSAQLSRWLRGSLRGR